MSTTRVQPRLRIAFAGTFSRRLEARVRAHLAMPCDVIRADEDEVVSQLPEADVLVTMAFTPEMGAAGRRLKLVQVPGAGLDRIDEVLRHADYLALTEATRGLLGERELRLMKPTTVLVNVARAEIVDEAALFRALAQRTIAGAALDVWYQYPEGPGPTFPARHAFQELPNVLMTPHVSGWTEGMLEARAQLIAENIHRTARGESPVHLIPASAA